MDFLWWFMVGKFDITMPRYVYYLYILGWPLVDILGVFLTDVILLISRGGGGGNGVNWFCRIWPLFSSANFRQPYKVGDVGIVMFHWITSINNAMITYLMKRKSKIFHHLFNGGWGDRVKPDCTRKPVGWIRIFRSIFRQPGAAPYQAKMEAQIFSLYQCSPQLLS
jgi:hypothetical protein